MAFPEPREPNPVDTPPGEVVASLEDSGYDGQFRAVAGAAVECLTCHNVMAADQLQADELTRLEGASDPADMTMVVPLACDRCGVKGTLVLPYGPGAGPEEAAVIRAMPRTPAEATRQSEIPGATPGIDP